MCPYMVSVQGSLCPQLVIDSGLVYGHLFPFDSHSESVTQVKGQNELAVSGAVCGDCGGLGSLTWVSRCIPKTSQR